MSIRLKCSLLFSFLMAAVVCFWMVVIIGLPLRRVLYVQESTASRRWIRRVRSAGGDIPSAARATAPSTWATARTATRLPVTVLARCHTVNSSTSILLLTFLHQLTVSCCSFVPPVRSLVLSLSIWLGSMSQQENQQQQIGD